jgi:Fe(3+) dicitrate transport protein
MRFFFAILIIFLLCAKTSAQYKLCGIVSDSSSLVLKGAVVYCVEKAQIELTDSKGKFCFENLSAGTYNLIVSANTYNSYNREIKLSSDSVILLELSFLEIQAPTVIVKLNDGKAFEHFRAVDWDNMIIGAGKKSEIISLDRIEANLAANNSRQIYARIGIRYQCRCIGIPRILLYSTCPSLR